MHSDAVFIPDPCYRINVLRMPVFFDDQKRQNRRHKDEQRKIDDKEFLDFCYCYIFHQLLYTVRCIQETKIRQRFPAFWLPAKKRLFSEF